MHAVPQAEDVTSHVPVLVRARAPPGLEVDRHMLVEVLVHMFPRGPSLDRAPAKFVLSEGPHPISPPTPVAVERVRGASFDCRLLEEQLLEIFVRRRRCMSSGRGWSSEANSNACRRKGSGPGPPLNPYCFAVRREPILGGDPIGEKGASSWVGVMVFISGTLQLCGGTDVSGSQSSRGLRLNSSSTSEFHISTPSASIATWLARRLGFVRAWWMGMDGGSIELRGREDSKHEIQDYSRCASFKLCVDAHEGKLAIADLTFQLNT